MMSLAALLRGQRQAIVENILVRFFGDLHGERHGRLTGVLVTVEMCSQCGRVDVESYCDAETSSETDRLPIALVATPSAVNERSAQSLTAVNNPSAVVLSVLCPTAFRWFRMPVRRWSLTSR